MVWIAVCDRDADRRNSMAALARRYLSARKELQGQVCLFASAEELLDYKYASFGVCLVNVEAPLHLEAGRDIKERLPQTALVFYGRGQEPVWALQAYRAGAAQYLFQPVGEQALFAALDRTVREGGLQRPQRILLNSTQGLVNLQVAQVAYAKSSGHRITFFLVDGEELESKCLRVSFGTVLAPLEGKGFLRCHDSYAVNLGWSVRLTGEGVQLADGTIVPVSTKKRSLTREALKHIQS